MFPRRNPSSLLVIGASARHVAQSARKLGIDCFAIDLFGDWDLRQVADVKIVESLAELDFVEISQWCAGTQDLLICGGMENRISVMDDLSLDFQVLGTELSGIQKTNDLEAIQTICRRTRIRFPESRLTRNDLEENDCGAWLIKPLRSAGGHRIRRLNRLEQSQGDEYYQQFVPGKSFSALYCCNGASTRMLGLTEQLCGSEVFASRDTPFAYCGSIWPFESELQPLKEVERAGEIFATEFGLRGVFGIDWVQDETGRNWMLEVNPRIPASSEVYERAGIIRNIVEVHIDACFNQQLPIVSETNQIAGKAVVYNQGTEKRVTKLVFERWMQWLASEELACADIPMPGDVIPSGGPIMTVFATGESHSAVKNELESKAFNVRESLKKARSFTPSS